MTDMATDDMDLSGGSNASNLPFMQLKWSAGNAYFQTTWDDLYLCIAQSNTIIEKVPEITQPFTITTKDVIVGEARFLRALEYFYLVQLWGSVPMPTHIANSVAETYAPKSPVDTIYSLIIKDLISAKATLNEGSRIPGAATKYAAQSLLAKVYLTKAGPDHINEYLVLAEAELRDVIKSNKYSLNAKFADYFDLTKKLSNPEAIYEHTCIGDQDGSVGSQMAYNMGVSYSGWLFNGVGAIYNGQNGNKVWQPTPGLWLAYNNLDVRKQMYINFYIKNPASSSRSFSNNAYPVIIKFMDGISSIKSYRANNLPVLRYSDVLLMYSEVLNELGITNINDGHDCYWYINQVRQRAFYGNTGNAAATITPGLTQDAFRKAVLNERWLEFAHEGQRLFDLRRTGTYISTMNAYVKQWGPLASNSTAATNEVKKAQYATVCTTTLYTMSSKTLYPGAAFITNTKKDSIVDPKYNTFPIPTIEVTTNHIEQNDLW